MKIIISIIVLIIPFSLSSHEVKLDNETTEKIINTRMKKMSEINNLSQKIYKQLNSDNFDILKENTLKLKQASIDFQDLFPHNSQGGKAKNIIWIEKILFDEYLIINTHNIDISESKIEKKKKIKKRLIYIEEHNI